MRVTFLGTGSFALPSLIALHAAGHEIAMVVCQPDRARGRGLELAPPPVKVEATRLGLRVLQPRRIKEPDVATTLHGLRPDIQVVVAYGQILPRAVIDIAPLGTVNVHGSLLPRWRGAAPIQWAIASGDEITGVTTMLIDEGLDTGPILGAAETPIGPDERAPELSARLAVLGAELLSDALFSLKSQKAAPRPQDPTLATHARPLGKEDGVIDWAMAARTIACRLRGFDPWPGAFTKFGGKLVKVLRAREIAGTRGPQGVISFVGREGLVVSCGAGSSLLVEEVQPESRRPMPAHSFARGARIVEGSAFCP